MHINKCIFASEFFSFLGEFVALDLLLCETKKIIHDTLSCIPWSAVHNSFSSVLHSLPLSVVVS